MQGILLAAGYGRRFDPGGRRNKLLTPLADDRPVAWHAARTLCRALPGSLAVIRPHESALAGVLHAAGCRVLECPEADQGMGSALAAAVRASAGARGWLVALGDMPWLPDGIVEAVAAAIDRPDRIAAATFDGRRGHPVAFGAAHGEALSSLRGDSGARELLRTHALCAVAAADDGVLRDIDTPADLRDGR